MKNNWRNNIRALAIILLAILSSCSKSSEHTDHADSYTCPMHPTVISDKPGSCPVCGMVLVRKVRQGEEVEITEDLAKLLKSPNESVVATIKTIKPEYKRVPLSIEAQGIVTYDTRNIFTIPARVGGRLEKVFLKYAFQQVTKGQKVAEIYSPELITAQRELLYLLESDAQNTELIQSAKNKIALLGASESQIASLIQRKEILNTFIIYSPYTGYLLIDGMQAPTTSTPAASGSTSGGGGNAMGASATNGSSTTANASQPSQASSLLREGNYVSSGQTLFKVVNTASLRVELDLPASQAGAIKKGAGIQLDFGNGNEADAVVDFIQPFFNEGEEFVKLRVYTNRTDQLQVGHLVKATLHVPAAESLWLPKEAILDLGLNQIVFIKERGVLIPKRISVGTKASGWIEVKQGLSTSDEIAANAQYLVDSESFVKTK
ncbi:MAG: efflux RND transporter periplasmic adaptor subunit [Chryseolinea sp.]